MDACCVLVICSDAFEEDEPVQDDVDQLTSPLISEGKQSFDAIIFPSSPSPPTTSSLPPSTPEVSMDNLEFLQITPDSIQIQVIST